MANAYTPPANGNGCHKWVLDTTDNILLPLPEDRVGCTWMIQVKTGGAAPGNFVIKQTVKGSGLSGSDLVAPIYTYTATATPPAAGTAVSTGGRIYQVVADGMDTYLVYTQD